MAVIGVGLAAFAIALALLQATSLTARLMAESETHAGKIAVEATRLLDTQLAKNLVEVSTAVAADLDTPWSKSDPWPVWLVSVYVRDGVRTHPLLPESGDHHAFIPSVEAALKAQLSVEPPSLWRNQTRFTYGSVGETPCIVATRRGHMRDGRPFVVGVRIDHLLLKARFIDPLVENAEGLEVVPVAEASSHWSRSLDGAMRFWAIQPTNAYRRQERAAVMGQTFAYVGLTMLALGSMLAAMWFLTRVARREMALTGAKADFVANMSHELRTPLALIKMFAETLESGRVASEEKRREYCAIISRESTRLTNLVDNILDFSRIEAGVKEYHRVPVDIGVVVRETYEAYCLELEEKGFEHSIAIADDLPEVAADRDAIAQAVVNLIGNAVKYSEDDRYLGIEVTRDTRRNRTGVLISLHDRGIGISPEARRHLFEGFYRADDERVRERSGSGLGLALLKHIVDAHQGSLHVESRLVKGTTFRIFLPAVSDVAAVGESTSDECGPDD